MATSPHSVFMVTSLLFAIISNMVVNVVYLGGRETHAEHLTADRIFAGKIGATCLFWLLGIAYGVFAYSLSPFLVMLDADIPAVGLEGLDTLSLIVLSSFPFLLLSGAMIYMTYVCSRNLAILASLILVGSIILLLAPISYGDIHLSAEGSELLSLSLAVAAASAAAAIIAVKRAGKAFCALYASTEPPA